MNPIGNGGAVRPLRTLVAKKLYKVLELLVTHHAFGRGLQVTLTRIRQPQFRAHLPTMLAHHLNQFELEQIQQEIAVNQNPYLVFYGMTGYGSANVRLVRKDEIHDQLYETGADVPDIEDVPPVSDEDDIPLLSGEED